MSAKVDLKSLAADAEKIQPWIVERRRHLHRNPELSFQEKETSAFLRREVEALGLTPSDPVAPGMYGFHADLIAPSNPNKMVLLRADMDALPILEENDIEFRSKNDGVGHLCGHDTHSTMLLGAAKLLSERREQLPVSVRFVFQHAEEVDPGGAVDFVNAGLTKDVAACFGLHVSPRVPSHQFGLISGEAMAMVGTIRATIRGRGGHGAAPHEAIDPVIATAACIMNLQQIVSRRIMPIEPCVVSITMLNAGSATNVIPSESKFAGTMRTYNEARGPEMQRLVKQIIADTAATYGCEAEVTAEFSYPPVINNPVAMQVCEDVIVEMFGADARFSSEKSMGAEDFAYFAREKPSGFVFLGALPPGETFHPLHHPQFLPDESVLWKGAALLAGVPFRLEKHFG